MKLNKRKLLLGFIAICTAPAFGQGMQFNIIVKLSSPAPGTMLFFNHISARSGETVTDSVLLVNGTAKFSGSTLYLQKAMLFAAPKNSGFDVEKAKDRLPVYLEAGNIAVTGKDILKTASVHGTRLNNDAQAFSELRKQYKEKQAVLFKSYSTIDHKDSTAMASLNRDAGQYSTDKAKAEEDFFYSHLNSPIALEWLRATINPAQEKTKATEMFSRMSKEVKESFSGKKYAETLAVAQSAEIGSVAPNFTSKTPDGKEVSLNSFRGKYVLLDFWASWCAPCRAENPNVLKAYQKYSNQNFTILACSLDDSRERWMKAIVADALPWTQVSDLASWNSSASKLFGVTAIPANFLIDPNGKIVARDLRGPALDEMLQKIIKL